MAIYCSIVQTLAETLASIDQPLRLEEFTNFLLDGLDEEYALIVELDRDRIDHQEGADQWGI
jgi:hypothetical protein